MPPVSDDEYFARELEEREEHSDPDWRPRNPCPTCDNDTEDPYGGPCSECWDLAIEQEGY